MSWLALCCAWQWKASAIPFDCRTKRWSDCYPRPTGARRADRGASARHQPYCIKPQIASRAETTRAAHDTFMDTLYGPIATLHRLITLKTCMIATTAKIKAETAA